MRNSSTSTDFVYPRTRISNSYSEWFAVMFGVPQGSILGPLLFNIFWADLFLMHSDIVIANFADDNTPYLFAKNVEDVIESLEQASVSLYRWFESNLLKGNVDKCHFLASTSQEVKNKKQWLWKTFRRQIWFQT